MVLILVSVFVNYIPWIWHRNIYSDIHVKTSLEWNNSSELAQMNIRIVFVAKML